MSGDSGVENEKCENDVLRVWKRVGGFEGPELALALHRDGEIYIHYKDGRYPQIATGYTVGRCEKNVLNGDWYVYFPRPDVKSDVNPGQEQIELLPLPPGSVWSAGSLGHYVILCIDGKERVALHLTKANRVAGNPPELEQICFLDRLVPEEIEELGLVQVDGQEAGKMLNKALEIALKKTAELMEMNSIWNNACAKLVNFRL